MHLAKKPKYGKDGLILGVSENFGKPPSAISRGSFEPKILLLLAVIWMFASDYPKRRRKRRRRRIRRRR